MSDVRSRPEQEMFTGRPPSWSLTRPKPVLQSVYDLLGAPLRMVVLPDHVNERLHLTSLRAERMARVLPELKGRVLDIGAGDNMLLKLYQQEKAGTREAEAANASVGLDVFDWGGGCMIVPDCKSLPFEDASFDTVAYVACINHIPEREEALAESLRVLKPGGQLIITMIGRLIGGVGHAVWWYSEDKHRHVDEEEEMGMDPSEVIGMVKKAGFSNIRHDRFVYGLNSLYLATRP